jgi:hypothetical protein
MLKALGILDPASKLLSSLQASSNGLQTLSIVAPASFGDFPCAE